MEKERRSVLVNNESGAALVVGLLITLVLTILTVGAMMSTSTALNISGNGRAAMEAFYSAEAGLEDARSRLQTTAPTAYKITDSYMASTDWLTCIGTSTQCVAKGYDSGNSHHARVDRLPLTSLDYVVTIRHRVLGGSVLLWGDSNGDGISEENTMTGTPIYVIESQGITVTGGVKSVRTEVVSPPPIGVPSALYTKADTTVRGTSTHVIGNDGCGSSNLPAILTRGALTTSGGPTIDGSPIDYQTGPSVVNLDIDSMINRYKGRAEYTYNIAENTVYSSVHWGEPEGRAGTTTTCDGEHHVVYFNAAKTYNVKLTGGSSGCGLLLVEGDLELQGGFKWNGVILVTGTITFRGGGEENVTGAILAGGSLAADVDIVAGNAEIYNCSTAIREQTEDLPYMVLRWAEIFG